MKGAIKKQSNVSTNPKISSAEGVNFMIPLPSEDPFDIRKLTVQKIAQFENDPYANKIELNLINLIFQKPYIINILDKGENSREDIAIWFRHMCEEFDLWNQMQRCFIGWFWYGCYLHSDGIGRDDEGHIVLKEIRDLPSRTFSYPGIPDNGILTYGKLLQGVMLQGDKKVHYWQEQLAIEATAGAGNGNSNSVIELKNCAHIPSPVFNRYDLAGVPMINPLIQILARMSFSWQTLMACNNRAGVPTMFMRVTNPIKTPDGKRDDWKYSNKILRNADKNTLFTIHDNFEPLEIKAAVPDISLKTVDALTNLIISIFSPTDFLSKEGSLIGGSTNAEANLLINFITGFHNHLIRAFKPLLQRILEYNGYLDLEVDLQIPAPVFIDEAVQLNKAIEIRTSKAGSIDEYRAFMQLESASPEFLKKCKEEWEELSPVPEVLAPFAQGGQEAGKQAPPGKANAKAKGNPAKSAKKEALGDKEVNKEEEALKKNQRTIPDAIPEREDIERTLENKLEEAWTVFINSVQKIPVVQ